MNGWPQSKFNERFQAVFPDGEPARNRRYVITRADGAKIHGVTDAMGNIDLQKGLGPETLSLDILDEAEGGMS